MVLYGKIGKDGCEKQPQALRFPLRTNLHRKVSKLFGNKEKYNNSMMALKTVDLAINHKPVDKPLNKALHLVNDILTEIVTTTSKNKEAKRTASGISLLVDLAIDFLVRS